MKILYIINGLGYGGLERQLTIFIKEIAPMNNKIYLQIYSDINMLCIS